MGAPAKTCFYIHFPFTPEEVKKKRSLPTIFSFEPNRKNSQKPLALIYISPASMVHL